MDNYQLENRVAELEQNVATLTQLLEIQSTLLNKLAYRLTEAEMPIEMWAARFNK